MFTEEFGWENFKILKNIYGEKVKTMKCVNQVILTGHIATDPQQISGTSAGAKFRLATNEKHYSKMRQQYVVTSEFHTIKCWKQNADFVLGGCGKGSYVMVIGKLHHHNYETANGNRGVNSEVIATDVIRLTKASNDLDLED